MANIIIPSRRIWTRQPQQAVAIDWSNPLTHGLADVIDLRIIPRSLILGTPASVFGSSLAYGRPTKNGLSFDNTQSYGGVYFQRADGAYATAEQTHLTIGQYDVSSGFYAGYFCTADGSGASASMSLQSAAGADVLVYPGGNTYAGVEAALLGAGQLVLALASKPGATDIYKNGVLIGSGSNSPDVKTTSRLVIFGERAALTAYSVKGKQLLHLFFNKKLSAAQIAALSENPWQIFRPQPRRLFFDAAVGGGNLSASATGGGIATGTAALAAQVALASVGVSTASGSAALAASVPLSAVGLSVASGSAAPSATVTISASGLAQAAGQAGLSASVLAQAAGAALASGNATLAAQLNALATGAAQAGGSANLSGGAAGSLSASGAAIAAGTAVLSVTVGLQAAGSALASGTATGSANAPGQVSATGGAAAGGSGVMSARVSITAAGFVQAMGQGAFSATVPLSAFGVVTASGYAHLTVDNGVVMVRAPSGYRTSLIAYNSTRPRQSITIRPISLNTRR